jgi:predicted AlkP superfamily phosphohydrolase/phosphomutase
MNRREFVVGGATATTATLLPSACGLSSESSSASGGSSAGRRVLFLAVDGMDPALVQRYLDHLPNMRRIMSDGYSGRILPYVSCWGNIDFMSMMTGAAPGTQYRSTAGGRPQRHSQCVSETVWHVLAEDGRKSLLFDFPGAQPEENVATAAGMTLASGVIYQTPDIHLEGLYSEGVESTGWPPGGGPKPGRRPTVIQPPKPAGNWASPPASKRPPLAVELGDQAGLVIAEGAGYDTVVIYDSPGGRELARTAVGAWADWAAVAAKNRTGSVRYRLLELASDGSSLQLLRSPICAREGYSQPASLAEGLAREVGPIWKGSAIPPTPHDPYWRVGEAESRAGLEQVAKAALAALDLWDWHLYVHKVSIVDTALHQCLTMADPSYHKYDAALGARADEAYRQAFIDLDFVAGQLMEALEQRDDTVLIIGSDHGGGVNNVVCDIDQYLKDAGLLRKSGREIDWRQTKAYTKRSRQGTEIFINLQGREPGGTVRAEDYEAVQEKVIDLLLDWRSPLDNKRVITYALKLRDAALLGYWGPEAGDIQLCYNPGFVWGVNPNGSAIAASSSPVSNHGPQIVTGETGYSSMMGQILAWGPGVARGVERDEAAAGPIPIAAVAPTLSRLLGCRAPADCQLGPIEEMLA